MQPTIRQGESRDADPLIALDHMTTLDPRRIDLIRRTIEAGTCFVAELHGEVVGYAVLDYSFYDKGTIAVLYTKKERRRHGIGSALVGHIEGLCQTTKLFTSTNLSNKPMQTLLAKHRFTLTGFIDNLDEGDPELIYFKRLRDGSG